MSGKVYIYVEDPPMNVQHAITFANDVEVDGTNTNVYLDKTRALLALVYLADMIGAEVFYEGERVEVEL